MDVCVVTLKCVMSIKHILCHLIKDMEIIHFKHNKGIKIKRRNIIQCTPSPMLSEVFVFKHTVDTTYFIYQKGMIEIPLTD